MSITIVTLISVLAVLMLVCGWCGYRVRIFAFLCTLVLGFALNTVWMVFGLNAQPFEAHALMAQMSLFLYGLGAFGVGFLGGRLARAFQASRVEN